MPDPHYSDDWLTVYAGDCRDVMAGMEPDSVQCVVTSPPYYGLRDYGLPPSVWGGELEHEHEWVGLPPTKETRGGQASTLEGTYNEAGRFDRIHGSRCACGAWCGTLGLEPDPAMFVEHMVDVFRAVRRVLRTDGMVWLNLGDTYADRANRRSDGESYRNDRADVVPGKQNTIGGAWRLKAKDRMLIPARVAIALQDDGWWVRDEVIWHKPNPMPSSVEDRTTPAHEMIYTLTKRGRYWSDYDAIRELRPARELEREANGYRQVDSIQTNPSATPPGTAPHTGLHRVKVPGGWDVTKGEGGHGSVHREGRTEATYVETDRRWPRGWANGDDRGHDPQVGRYEPPPDYVREVPAGRNKRSVWTIATQPYPAAHFATFPEALVKPMILAGSPPGALVLDPFGGSGTVALVAQRLGRRTVLIDLSTEYIGQMIERVAAGRAAGEGPAVDMPVPFAEDGLWGEVPA